MWLIILISICTLARILLYLCQQKGSANVQRHENASKDSGNGKAKRRLRMLSRSSNAYPRIHTLQKNPDPSPVMGNDKPQPIKGSNKTQAGPAQTSLDLTKTVRTNCAPIRPLNRAQTQPPEQHMDAVERAIEKEACALASSLASEANLSLKDSRWLYKEIISRDGIAPHRGGDLSEEYQEIPICYRRKAGLTPDEMASEMGMTEAELMSAISKVESIKDALPRVNGRRVRQWRVKDFSHEAYSRIVTMKRMEDEYGEAAD